MIFSVTCSNSLTLSIGATAVLEIAAAIPPAKKSFKKLTTPSAMLGCYTCTVPILSTVLTETQRPSKCPRTPPTVLIYRRHLSREFWVMDLDLVKQKSRTKYISEFKVQDARHVPLVKWGVTLGTFKGRSVSFYYNLMHLIVVKSIFYQGKLFNFKSFLLHNLHTNMNLWLIWFPRFKKYKSWLSF